MEKDFNAHPAGPAPASESSLDYCSLDMRVQFDAWLDTLRPRRPLDRDVRPQPRASDDQEADFHVECGEGTTCRLSFEGVLNLAGFFAGFIHSDTGTLVTGGGVIEANIEVGGSAFIDATVNGNVRATERVVLYSQARVLGNIVASGLSLKPGALFEGDCILHEYVAPRLVSLERDLAAEFVDQH
jgi:cytoskeletal protein CcmA (bactofilin family)